MNLAPSLHDLWTAGNLPAQASGSGAPSWVGVLIWSAVLIVLVTVGGLVLLAIRRRLFGSHESTHDAGLVMEELRRMRDRGEISDEEFRATRSAMIERDWGGAPAGDAAPPARPVASPRPRVDEAEEGDLRARPGFDLTGEPLPGFGDPDPPPANGEKTG
ncbi:MAG: SHOCT domain-containing protein [Phycisphaerales bacterium JB037]